MQVSFPEIQVYFMRHAGLFYQTRRSGLRIACALRAPTHSDARRISIYHVCVCVCVYWGADTAGMQWGGEGQSRDTSRDAEVRAERDEVLGRWRDTAPFARSFFFCSFCF